MCLKILFESPSKRDFNEWSLKPGPAFQNDSVKLAPGTQPGSPGRDNISSSEWHSEENVAQGDCVWTPDYLFAAVTGLA
jgi:hypothetical protein